MLPAEIQLSQDDIDSILAEHHDTGRATCPACQSPMTVKLHNPPFEDPTVSGYVITCRNLRCGKRASKYE